MQIISTVKTVRSENIQGLIEITNQFIATLAKKGNSC